IKHAAAPLPNGKVLVTGGTDGNGQITSTAAVFDPSINGWTSVPSMSAARNLPSATALVDGRVLVTGGEGINYSYMTGAQIYDPTTNGWSSGGAMTYGRINHAATLMNNGQVLITGGYFGGSFDLDLYYLRSADLFYVSSLGQPCGAPGDCPSGFCADGVC